MLDKGTDSLVYVHTWRHVFRLQADLSVFAVDTGEPSRGSRCGFPAHCCVRVHIILEELFLETKSRQEGRLTVRNDTDILVKAGAIFLAITLSREVGHAVFPCIH